jgi:TonB family protein
MSSSMDNYETAAEAGSSPLERRRAGGASVRMCILISLFIHMAAIALMADAVTGGRLLAGNRGTSSAGTAPAKCIWRPEETVPAFEVLPDESTESSITPQPAEEAVSIVETPEEFERFRGMQSLPEEPTDATTTVFADIGADCAGYPDVSPRDPGRIPNGKTPDALAGSSSGPVAGESAASAEDNKGDYTPPAVTTRTHPRYPREAVRKEIEGRVVLRATVGTDGKCEKVEVVSSSGFEMLDESAAESVISWKFAPACRNSKAIPGTILVPVVFRIQ